MKLWNRKIFADSNRDIDTTISTIIDFGGVVSISKDTNEIDVLNDDNSIIAEYLPAGVVLDDNLEQIFTENFDVTSVEAPLYPDYNLLEEYLWDLIVPQLPEESGTYKISRKAEMYIDVSGFLDVDSRNLTIEDAQINGVRSKILQMKID